MPEQDPHPDNETNPAPNQEPPEPTTPVTPGEHPAGTARSADTPTPDAAATAAAGPTAAGPTAAGPMAAGPTAHSPAGGQRRTRRVTRRTSTSEDIEETITEDLPLVAYQGPGSTHPAPVG